MGRVEFGAKRLKNGQFQPFFQFTETGYTVEFVASITTPDEKLARDLVCACYKILTGEQKNMKYDRNGNA